MARKKKQLHRTSSIAFIGLVQVGFAFPKLNFNPGCPEYYLLHTFHLLECAIVCCYASCLTKCTLIIAEYWVIETHCEHGDHL